MRRRALGAVRWAARLVRAGRAGRARQASVSGRGAQGARDVQASGPAERRRAGGSARQAQAWALEALGVRVRGARRGRASWARGRAGARRGRAAWACLCA